MTPCRHRNEMLLSVVYNSTAVHTYLHTFTPLIQYDPDIGGSSYYFISEAHYSVGSLCASDVLGHANIERFV